MQKARRHPVGLRPLVGNWFQVLFHSPVRGAFHLSLTVLCAIGLSRVFSLTGWSPLIRPGFLVSGVTQDTAGLRFTSHTGVSPSLPHTSICFRSFRSCRVAVLLPRRVRKPDGLGSSPFARHYSGNHCCFLFLPLLRCFSSRRSPHKCGSGSSIHWVAPFGNHRITGHLHLPDAYRSLSRPSSPSRAKASACCPFLLLLCFVLLCSSASALTSFSPKPVSKYSRIFLI